MATRRDQRTGAAYRACARAYQRRLRYYRLLHDNEEGEPSQPAPANRPVEAIDLDLEGVPNPIQSFECDDEESYAASDSSYDNMSEVEELFADLLDDPVADHPYGNDYSLKDSLRLWVLQTCQTRKATNLLLAILRQHLPEHNLPKDRRTLLGTPVGISKEFANVGGGQQWVHGIAECLQSYYRNYQPEVHYLNLDFFVDGLPLYNSSRLQFWPVLMKVRNVQDAPVMTVSIFSGEAKPSSAEAYLRPFVTEMNKLQDEGITIGGHHYTVTFNCLISDTPARSFAKGVAQHNSYHGCGKCTIVGEWGMNRMFFRYDAPREDRTDEQFRAGAYPEHVLFSTPLTDLHNCDLIRDVVSTESMHLLYKGAMYRLLYMWTHNVAGMTKMLSNAQQQQVSAHWQSLQLPSDFRRRPRALEYFKLWKASELKMFLHFGGPVILKGVLPDAAYQHFMLLFVAVTLLSSFRYRAKWEWADALLHKFVEDYADVYSPYLINSNVHNLLHSYDDSGRFGTLEDMSACYHEGKLKEIKQYVHSGNNSLAQAANRLLELQQIEVATRPRDPSAYVSVRQLGTDTITMVRRGLVLRRNFRDQWFLTTTGHVVHYETGQKNKGKLVVQGYPFTNQVPAFSYPCSSAEIDIYSASITDLNMESLKSFSAEQILCKVAAVQFAEGTETWFFPLPHTFLPSPPPSSDDVDDMNVD